MSNSVHDLAGAYAVHALDTEEESSFETHLASCAVCREEVEALRDVLGDLSAITAEDPPPSLRASVLGSLSSTPQDRPGIGHTPGAIREIGSARSAPRRRWSTRLLAAAASILIVGGGFTAWRVAQDDSPATVAQRITQADDATAVEQPLNGGGTATVTRSPALGRAVIMTSGLPTPPKDRVYQLWLQKPDGEFAAAGLVPSGGDQVVVLDGDAAAAAGAGITVEPAGGSPAPTTRPLALFAFA